MRDIYLIDFENVASEGLSGITYLSEEDQVIIFYSNNSNRLTMKMHILIGKSVCKLDYFEVTVGGKNALDHQIATWLGYLIGTGAAERNYYIVSRDMGYKHVANFWAGNKNAPRVRCVDTIRSASRLERNRRDAKESVLQAVPVEASVEPAAEVASVTAEETAAEQVVTAVELLPVELSVPDLTKEPETVPEETAQTVTPDTEPEVPVEKEATAEDDSSRKNYRNRTRVRRSRGKSYSRENQNTDSSAAEKDASAAAVDEATEAEPVKVQRMEEAPKQEKRQSQKQTNRQSKDKTDETKQTGDLDQLAVMIAPYPKLQESVLRDLIANNKRQILCNTLRKHLGQEKGLALYNEIKRTAWH